MRNCKFGIFLSLVFILGSVMAQGQTYELIIRKTIGKYMVADYLKRVPSKKSDEADKVTNLFMAIFEASDTEGKKPLYKIENYDFISHSEDKLIVKQNGKYGIFDFSKGVWAEPAVNKYIMEIKPVGNLMIEGKNVRLLNKNLELIKAFAFKNVDFHGDGKFYDADQNGKNAIIYSTTDGSELYNLGTVEIWEVFDELYIVVKEKKMGIMDANKNMLLPADYLDIELLDNSYDHLKIGLNTDKGYQQGLVKYADGKFEIVFQADNDYITTINPMNYKGAEAVYYRGKLNVGADFLDAEKKVVKHLNFYKEAMEFSSLDDKFIMGTDDSYDYYWVADDDGNLVGTKFNEYQRVNDRELKDYYIFTGNETYHSTIVNAATKQKMEFNDYLYESGKINNTLIFETEMGGVAYFKMNKARNDLQPILPNSMTGWMHEVMELPGGYIAIQLAKNSFMVYDAFNDVAVAQGDLISVKNQTVKHIIAEMNKEFSVKNPASDELKNSVSLAPFFHSGNVTTYTYSVNGTELFGKDSLHHYVSFSRANFSKDSKINIGSMSFYPDYDKPEVYISAVFDENYNMILPFREGMIQPFGKENANGMPDGYVVVSFNGDSMNVILNEAKRTLPNKIFPFINASEEMPGMHLSGNILFVEDWMTDNGYVMDFSGNVYKKIKLSELDAIDGDHAVASYSDKPYVYFMRALKEMPLKSETAIRLPNSNILSVMNDLTDEINLYDIRSGALVNSEKFEYFQEYTKLYSMVYKEEKIAVLSHTDAKFVSGYEFTFEQAKDFIDARPDVIEMKRQERMKHDELVKSGDKNFSRKDWSKALLNYTEAKKYTSDMSYLNRQIEATNKGIRIQDSMIRETDKVYQSYFIEGNEALAAKDYDRAKKFFQMASNLKPSESLPKEKLKSCDEAIADQQKRIAMEKAFLDTMAQGDKFMRDKDYQKAIASFEKALSYRPGDPTPASKIQECKDAMK